jgi:hypothetical protein
MPVVAFNEVPSDMAIDICSVIKYESVFAANEPAELKHNN